MIISRYINNLVALCFAILLIGGCRQSTKTVNQSKPTMPTRIEYSQTTCGVCGNSVGDSNSQVDVGNGMVAVCSDACAQVARTNPQRFRLEAPPPAAGALPTEQKKYAKYDMKMAPDANCPECGMTVKNPVTFDTEYGKVILCSQECKINAEKHPKKFQLMAPPPASNK